MKVPGKYLLLASVSLGIIIFSSLLFFWGSEKTWSLWSVPTLSPNFADLRIVTSGAESKALGFDPLINNPQEPWGRQLIYPRIWQMLYLAGINQTHTAYFGVALAVLFVIGLFLYAPSTLDRMTAAVLMLSIFSPAVLLGLERGNIDILMFFLLAAAIFCMKQNLAAVKALAVALVLVAFVLKIFPLFGIGLILSQKKHVALKAGLVAGIFAILYVAANYNDLLIIRRVITPFSVNAYGFDLLWINVGGSWPAGQIRTELGYVAIALCLVLALFAIFSPRFENMETGDPDPRTLDAFRVGSGIYLGTFMFWNNNGNYRLVFLLFVIPQLMLWVRSPSRWISIISKSTLLAILISLWSLALSPLADNLHLNLWGTLLHHISHLLIFAGLLFLFASSAPQWIKDGAASLDARLRRWGRQSK
jgi:hypothetical protein